MELADGFIWIGPHVVTLQMKEREQSSAGNAAAEEKWFNKKVLKLAVRQTRDTLSMLDSDKNVEIPNLHGHKFKYSKDKIRTIDKLIVYRAGENLPYNCRQLKHHPSKTAGFIHVMSSVNYMGVIEFLHTPAEFIDYLSFREWVITNFPFICSHLTEQALLGQYITDHDASTPSREFAFALADTDHDHETWNINTIMANFKERITFQSVDKSYYPVLTEMALLKISELAQFKTRFLLALKQSNKNDCPSPFVMIPQRTNCGIVVVPVPKTDTKDQNRYLMMMTMLFKQRFKLDKVVGASVLDLPNEYLDVLWTYADHPWTPDQEMDQMLAKDSPFRSTKTAKVERYNFKNEEN